MLNIVRNPEIKKFLGKDLLAIPKKRFGESCFEGLLCFPIFPHFSF